MEVSKNYKNYVKGFEPLQNAIHTDPNDKAINMIKSNINRRFWISDYNSFKKGLSTDQKFKKINENLTKEPIQFSKVVDNISLFNIPKELIDEDKGEELFHCNGKLSYSAHIIVDRGGIEKIMFSLTSVELNVSVVEYEDGSNDLSKPEEIYDIILKAPQSNKTRFNIYNMPLYKISFDIDCRNTMDYSKWYVSSIDFGDFRKD